jgi:hypothetical protein
MKNPSKFALRAKSTQEFLGTIGLPVTDKRYAKTFDSIAAAQKFLKANGLAARYDIVWIG